jgi:hypothetical protein
MKRKLRKYTIYNSIKETYLGVNVTKKVKDLCNDNYNTFLKEI